MTWPMVKLSDVCEINIGKTPPRNSSTYWGVGNPWLSIADMSQGRNISTTKEQITDKAIKDTNINIVKKGTVLFSFKLSIGKIGITSIDLYTNEAIAALPIKNNSILSSKYLVYALSQLNFALKTDRAVMGATLNKKKLAELEIPLPPLAEQQRIAAILDKADAIRQKRQQAIALADQFLRSVFLDMFGDPVTNPKGWPTKKLGKVVDCINGDRSSNYPSGNDIVDSGILFLSTKNITNGRLDLSTTQYITRVKFDSLSRGKLQKNDLVITLRGTLAQSAIFDTHLDTGFINAQLMILRCSNDINPVFLQALLMSKSFNSYLKSIGNGAAVPQLTASQINNLDIYPPPKAEQEKYLKIANTVSDFEQKQNPFLSNNIFNSLAQKAFSGQL